MRAPIFIFTLVAIMQLAWFQPMPKSQSKLSTQKELLLGIEGLVNVDGKPSAASIEINSNFKHHSTIERVSASASTGVFKTTLKAGDEYEMIIKVNKLPQQILFISTKHLDTSKTMNVFVDFTSAAYDHKLEALRKSVEEKLRSDMKMSSFEKQYGKVKKDKLVYKIQVGAFKFYENFNYTSVMELPKIIRKTDSDFITRFTIGNYTTYSEALKMLKKVQACDLKEAFIIAYYDGERKLLNQLINEKILN